MGILGFVGGFVLIRAIMFSRRNGDRRTRVERTFLADTPRAVLGSRAVSAYLSRKHWLT
jgi:hypothetical protein